MMNNTSTLWQLIEDWLNDNHRTQTELARMSGLAPSTITTIKQNAATPDWNTLNKLADAMGLPRTVLHEAAGFIQDDDDIEDVPRTLAHLWHQLGDRDRVLVEGMMRQMIRTAQNSENHSG